MKLKKSLIVLVLLNIALGLFSYERVFYGVASYYGRKFHGKKTASGEVFNMYKYTAAHKTLPLGSKIKVTNLSNHKSIIVKVNDRGPFVGNRVLDLSYGAAKRLGYVRKGLTKVKAEVVYLAPEGRNYNSNRYPPSEVNEEDNSNRQEGSSAPEAINSAQPIQGGRILRIQLGAFNNKENAEKMVLKLKSLGVEAEIVVVRSVSNNFYKVYSIEKFRMLNRAFTKLNEIRSKNIEAFIIGQYYARTR